MDFNLINHLFPNDLPIDNKIVPILVFDLGLMPMFMVEHLIIAFNPNTLKSNSPWKVPDFKLFAVLFGNSYPKQRLFPIEAIIVANSSSTKFMHNEGSPSPCPPSLDAVPNFVFD